MTTAAVNKVCAWCKAPMGWIDGLEPGQISHGMCASCFDAQERARSETRAVPRPQEPVPQRRES